MSILFCPYCLAVPLAELNYLDSEVTDEPFDYCFGPSLIEEPLYVFPFEEHTRVYDPLIEQHHTLQAGERHFDLREIITDLHRIASSCELLSNM